MLPVKGKHVISQGYGLTAFAKSALGRLIYKNFPGRIHPGLDFATYGKAIPVVASAPGKTVRAGLDGAWGNHVEVKGSDGWNRQYAHLSKITVHLGQMVEEGQEIGLVGSTGSSTGYHLHWGHRRAKLIGGNEYRDPTFELKVSSPVPQPITARILKANDSALPNIYVYNGRMKFRIPDLETFRFFFGSEKHTLVDAAILEKIPEGEPLPSLK